MADAAVLNNPLNTTDEPEWKSMSEEDKKESVREIRENLDAAREAAYSPELQTAVAAESEPASEPEKTTNKTTVKGDETPAVDDAAASDTTGDEGDEGADWLDQDTRDFATTIGLTSDELDEFESREELERALRIIDRKAFEAGKASTAAADKPASEPTPKPAAKPADASKDDPWADVSRFKLPTGEGEFDEAAARPFNEFVDVAGETIRALRQELAGIRQHRASEDAQRIRSEAVKSIHSLGHADLFGKPGEKLTAEQTANLEKALDAHFTHARGLIASGRNVAPTPAFLKAAVNSAFGDQIQKTEQRRMVDRMRKQSARRTGGSTGKGIAPPAATNKPKWEQVREKVNPLYRDLVSEGNG